MKGGDGKDFQVSNECIKQISKRIILNIFEICLENMKFSMCFLKVLSCKYC